MGSKTVTYTYDDAGRNTRMVYPNGIQRDNTFDDISLITQIKYTKSTSTLLKFDYEYDKIGNITRKKITWKSGKITDWHYQYDNLNRLKRVTLSQNSRVTKTYYTYDKVGNRLTKESMAYKSGSSSGDSMTGLSDKIVYEYNADNELLNADDVDFEFDLNGNMVSKKEQDGDETQYVYNKMGKLIKIIDTDDSQTKYYYRHDGLRYRKVEKDNDQILYFWGAGAIPPLLSERKIKNGETGSGSGTGKKLASYPPGVNCIRVYNYSTGKGYNYYYLTDHLGSVYYLTDEKANIVNTYNYDEFGNVLSKSQKIYNPMGFTGEQQHAEEDGLIYLRNRYYIPELGRFNRKDPISSINYYPYVSNQPINSIDPLGLSDWGFLTGSQREELMRRETKEINWSRFPSDMLNILGSSSDFVTVGPYGNPDPEKWGTWDDPGTWNDLISYTYEYGLVWGVIESSLLGVAVVAAASATILGIYELATGTITMIESQGNNIFRIMNYKINRWYISPPKNIDSLMKECPKPQFKWGWRLDKPHGHNPEIHHHFWTR